MPTNVTAAEKTKLQLTLYQGGFAHISETRFIPPLTEDLIVHYHDIPKLIEADSTIVIGLDISEQSFAFIPDKQALLNRIEGREIMVYTPETGEERVFILLNANGGLIVGDTEGKVIVDPKGEVQLSNSIGLPFSPTLIWQVERQTSPTLQLTYLTGGFSWEADYVVMIKGNQFAMRSWATIRNDSGMDVMNTELRLMAGTVNRAVSLRTMEFSAAKLPTEQSFADFHLYTYPMRVSILDQQQKHFQLISTDHSGFETIYEVREGQRHPSITIVFKNTEKNGLGIPLPAGQVKVYKEENGVSAFIGEDSIGHTAVNETVKLTTGEAFDITVYSGDVDRYVRDGFEYEVMLYEIRNQKDEAVEILIRHIPDKVLWTVEESSHPWERKGNEIQIRLTIPANTNQDVKFTIKYDRSVENRR
ncbi:DUF4139 domain-containing protein [Chungangia koreensis]|uniref:DUF4139 domain-containing protein n=1 Tax=Chungangia koreensis TaxID=752657 RepID=A0ABV8X5W9_9LACT